MSDDKGKDEYREEGQRKDEHVEEAVVPPSHAVPHPGTVVVKTLCVDRERVKSLMQAIFGLPHTQTILAILVSRFSIFRVFV